MTAPKRIGVVLSSGGGRGVFAHTGFLLALQHLNISVSAIAGCSAGAVAGGIAASGRNPSQWSDNLARVRRRDFWQPDSWPRILWNLILRRGRGWMGISDVQNAIDFIRTNLAVPTFEECPVPFYAVAMNLSRGTKTLFSKGELAPRIMASAAIPFFYRPVKIDGELYTDGAVIELAPPEAICCAHDLDALIIHHVASREYPAADARNQQWSFLEILYRQLYRHHPWYLSGKPLSFHRCPGACKAVILVLEPALPELIWPMHEGGTKVQCSALEQAIALLRPCLAALTTDPRSLLKRELES